MLNKVIRVGSSLKGLVSLSKEETPGAYKQVRANDSLTCPTGPSKEHSRAERKTNIEILHLQSSASDTRIHSQNSVSNTRRKSKHGIQANHI